MSHLDAELNPICHLLALLGVHPILHISRIRVNEMVLWNCEHYMAYHERNCVRLKDTLERCMQLTIIFLNKERKTKNNFHVAGPNWELYWALIGQCKTPLVLY